MLHYTLLSIESQQLFWSLNPRSYGRLNSRMDDPATEYVQDEKAELSVQREKLDLELREEKADTQRRMAWTAMGAMLFATAWLFSPIMSDDRVHALSDLLGLFYIAQAGVIGAYMGMSAYMSRR